MPEVGLGIGRDRRVLGTLEQEELAWYDERGNRYLTAEEKEQQEHLRAERLAARLRELGEDPDSL